MWGSKSQITKSSEFFQGFNIFQIMVESTYGKIHKTLKTLFAQEYIEEYKLPKVIVIGNESTGKSSLLENITKCQLFPRDNKLCTKCPIHVKLNTGDNKYLISYLRENGENVVVSITDKNNIHKFIDEYMKKLPTDYISDKEILIEITEPNIFAFELYDLPGIRSYPKIAAETTMQLCRKYLEDKNSIVLCVVPSTTTRLTSCQSIALISEMKIEHNCILALTMTDRLQNENIEELLIKRILKTSDELTGLNFAGYVAVVNRTNTDIFSLEDNDKNELKWFDYNILSKIPEQYKQYEENIRDNITISNLIKKIDQLYSNFIRNEWKPRIMTKINENLTKIKNEYYNLGSEKYDHDEINKCLTLFIHNVFLSFINQLPKHTVQPNTLGELQNNQRLKPLRPNSTIPSFNTQNTENTQTNYPNTPTYSKKLKEMHKTLVNKYDVIIKPAPDLEDSFYEIPTDNQEMPIEYNYYQMIDFINRICEKYYTINVSFIIHAINNYFEIEQNIKIIRFEKARCKLTDDLLSNHAKLLDKINDIKSICIADLLNKFIMSSETYTNTEYYKNMVYKLYKLHILYPLLWINISYTIDDYVESDEYMQKRKELMQQFLKIQSHYNNIAGII